MSRLFLVYLVVQLLSTAFALAVIEFVKPVIGEKNVDGKKYKLNSNSLYDFSNISDVLKGFIPMYSLFKVVNLIIDNQKNNVSNSVKNISVDETLFENNSLIEDEDQKERNAVMSIYKPKFEMTTDKYTAKKNKTEKLYDIYETPSEFIEREFRESNELNITPFEDEQLVKKVLVKDETTNQDIAKAISNLSLREKMLLRDSLTEQIIYAQRDNCLKLEKDVA